MPSFISLSICEVSFSDSEILLLLTHFQTEHDFCLDIIFYKVRVYITIMTIQNINLGELILFNTLF
jgi:hypothetical protein